MFCIGYAFYILSGPHKMLPADYAAESRSAKVCTQQYKGCLKRLTRVKTGEYKAICGKDKKKKGELHERPREIYYPGHRD